MDLTVFANGANRNVSGVTEATTCSQIVYVLAHATNQKGKFMLVAKFNGSEYRLSQNEKPLDIFKKCKVEGYPVSFELRQLPTGAGPPTAPKPSPTSATNWTPNSSKLLPSPVTNISSFDSEICSITSKSNFHPLSSSHPSSSMASTSCSALPPNPPPKPAISHNVSLPVLKRNQPRPPPPSYDVVIGQKFNSLSRESSKSLLNVLNAPPNSSIQTPSELSPTSTTDDALASLSEEELKKLIEKQALTIASQKMQMLTLESSIEDREELELLQLKKQYHNLQMVLEKLRSENWPQQYEQAKAENEQLVKSKSQLQSAVEGRRREIEESIQLQHSLEAEIEALQRELEEEELLNALQNLPPDFDLNPPSVQLIEARNELDYALS